MTVILAGALLRIQWRPFADQAINAEIVRRLESIPTMMSSGNTNCAYVHVNQLDMLLDLFPNASYDVAVWLAWQPPFEAFYRFLVCTGVKLATDATGAVFSPSLPADHILQAMIRERSEPLKRLMGYYGVITEPVVITQPALFDVSALPAKKRQGRKVRA